MKNTSTNLRRIRKLTPCECWKLMGFTAEDFEKAKWVNNTNYIQGGSFNKCSAKLKTVKEKPTPENTETYVLCTTNVIQDMEILKTITKNYTEEESRENLQNVNFAITWLDEQELLECATNTTKCFTFMEMPCTMIKRSEVPVLMDIIVQVKMGKANTEKYMKITMESNLHLNKLFIILTLSVLIIESKIFGSMNQRANIQGYTQIIENSEKNTLLKISNLKMESIDQRTSNSELYKQAGNSIVVNVLEEIFKELGKIYDDFKSEVKEND